MKITIDQCGTSTITNVEGLRELEKQEAKAIKDALEYLLEKITSKSPLSR